MRAYLLHIFFFNLQGEVLIMLLFYHCYRLLLNEIVSLAFSQKPDERPVQYIGLKQRRI